jgi:hypothetical protein
MAPDLQTVIRANSLTKARAKALAQESARAPIFRLVAEGPRFGRRPWRLSVPDVHGILADHADWNAVSWSMEPGGLERLAQTLEWVYGRLPEEFGFEATWGAEDLIEAVVSRAELLHVVRAGRIGTQTRYRVLPA